MMRAMRRATHLVAFYLLASAATASAECAWVFWQEFTGSLTSESMVTISAWETKQACEQALAKKVSSDSESSRKDKDNNVTVDYMAGKPRVWVQSKGRPDLITTSTYVCLPDTIDPRGPKGR